LTEINVKLDIMAGFSSLVIIRGIYCVWRLCWPGAI